MIRTITLTLLVAAAHLCGPTALFAATHIINNKSVTLVAHSRADISKNWVIVTGLTKQDGSAHACSTNALYFDASDNEIAAMLMSAQLNGIQVDLSYEDGAASVSFPTMSSLNCRLIAVWNG